MDLKDKDILRRIECEPSYLKEISKPVRFDLLAVHSLTSSFSGELPCILLKLRHDLNIRHYRSSSSTITSRSRVSSDVFEKLTERRTYIFPGDVDKVRPTHSLPP